MKTKLFRTIGVLSFLAVISIWGSPLFSQEPTKRIHVVGPDGKFAPETIVHRFTQGELVVLPDGKVVASINGETTKGMGPGYVRLMDEGEGIQAEQPPGMGGMGMGGMGMESMGMYGAEMGLDPGSDGAVDPNEPPSNVLYPSPGSPNIFIATNPKNEFAFVPPSTSLVKKIQLREPATLIFSVPRQYAADRYVLLAMWTNGFVYPQFAFKSPLRVGMMPGMSDGGGGGGFAGGGPVENETGPGTSDWRFNTYVSYWQVASLTEPEKGDANGSHIASLTMPPGEIRVTLVPKDRFEEVQHNPKLLNQLSLTGGPSQIVVARSRKTAIANNTPIPLVADGAVDLEIRGDLSEAAMPDWSSDEQMIVLTRSGDTAKSPKLVDTDDYVRLADSTRDQRSDYRPLGIVAHPTADGTYLAIGLLPGEYQAWKVPKSKMERGTDFRRAIPIAPLQIDNVSSTTAGIVMRKTTAKIGSSSSSNTIVLPPPGRLGVTQSISDNPFSELANKPRPIDADKERKRRILMLAKQIQEMDRRVEVAKRMLTDLMRHEKMIPSLQPTDDPFAATPDPFGGNNSASGEDPFSSGPSTDPFGADPLQRDPFGGGSAKEDPFGAPSVPQKKASVDPFGN